MIDDLRRSIRLLAIDTKLTDELNAYKRKLYLDNPTISWHSMKERTFDYFLDLGYPLKAITEAWKLCESNYSRRTRCIDKTNSIVVSNDNVYFGTLTFNNDTLDKTNTNTRRKYVARYLKSISDNYIANIDFGDKEKNPQSNEREHYHCLIACAQPPFSWQYGFCKFEKVGNTDTDNLKVAKYVAKLTNHAMKVERTGKARRLIYSRATTPTHAPLWLLD